MIKSRCFIFKCARSNEKVLYQVHTNTVASHRNTIDFHSRILKLSLGIEWIAHIKAALQQYLLKFVRRHQLHLPVFTLSLYWNKKPSVSFYWFLGTSFVLVCQIFSFMEISAWQQRAYQLVTLNVFWHLLTLSSFLSFQVLIYLGIYTHR